MTVDLSDGEWQQVLGILAMAPWRDANPLLMRIGEQLRVRASTGAQQATTEETHRQTEAFNPTNSSGQGILKQ